MIMASYKKKSFPKGLFLRNMSTGEFHADPIFGKFPGFGRFCFFIAIHGVD